MSAALRILDVSGLEPPEPLQQALAAIDTLATGMCLCLLHRRDPLLLYPILEQQGFDHATHAIAHPDDHVPAYHIYIWSRNDADAEAVARRALGRSP